jgi:hypothetical protein
MVKAMMPQQPLLTTAIAKPVQRKAVLRSVRRQSAPTQQAWLVMTTWTASETGAQLVLTVAQTARPLEDQTQEARRVHDNQSLENQSLENQGLENQGLENQGPESQMMDRQVRSRRVSYAAVRFGNGWLIIQI